MVRQGKEKDKMTSSTLYTDLIKLEIWLTAGKITEAEYITLVHEAEKFYEKEDS